MIDMIEGFLPRWYPSSTTWLPRPVSLRHLEWMLEVVNLTSVFWSTVWHFQGKVDVNNVPVSSTTRPEGAAAATLAEEGTVVDIADAVDIEEDEEEEAAATRATWLRTVRPERPETRLRTPGFIVTNGRWW